MNSNIERCQISTPIREVNRLLDVCGYNVDIFDKKVAENSCGEGNILKEIVTRYITAGLESEKSNDEIKIGLESNIFGYEIQQEKLDNCRINLDYIASSYNIRNVKWNLVCCDYLSVKNENKFDFVIGNPPYISYKNLSLEERRYIKKHYETCKQGKFDIYYAFLEAGIKSIKPDGKMVYLVPSNMFKCTFGKQIREFIKFFLTDIYDYKTKKIFDKLTNSVILSISKSGNEGYINYHDLKDKIDFRIPTKELKNKWIFRQLNSENIDANIEYLRFGDYFHAQITIATLLNKAFILKDFKEEKEFVINKDYKIEKELVRKSVNPRLLKIESEEKIIFPYYYKESKFFRYSLEEFNNKFPFGKEYLLVFKEDLDKRNSHANTEWFEYGRAQALKKLDECKLLISILITKEVNTYILDKETIPTSGIFITKLKDYDLKIAQKILHSKAFMDYVKNIGIICNGKSYKITPNDINEFMFDKKFLEEVA